MAMRIVFGLLLTILGGLAMGDEPTPVEGKNRDKHKHVEPVTPAPDPEFSEVIDIEKRPKPRPQPRPDEPDAAPDQQRQVIVYRGSWSSWFGGVFCGLAIGIVGSWLASLASVGAWIGRLLGR